jgi:Secretory lipase
MKRKARTTMNRVWRHGLLLGLALAATAAQGSAEAAVPIASADPFFAVPANIAGLPNGTILASRPVEAYSLGVPLPANAWQVKYKTLNNEGQASADVTTVMVPTAPWTGPGPRPLVSYQVAEDGVGTKCAASYALSAGLAAIDSVSEAQTYEVLLAIDRGWAVAAPDYEGPDSQFLGARGEADGVLDGIRAALAFKAAGFSTRTPVAMWGYSGGALASSLAAQAQKTYAPGLHLVAIALGGEVANLYATFQGFDDSYDSAGGGAVIVGIIGIDRSYPKADLEQYLNATGRQAVASEQTACLTDGIIDHPFLNSDSYERSPGDFQLPSVISLLEGISPLGQPGEPKAPVYDYHAPDDEFAPNGPDDQLMARYCAAGVTVDHYVEPVGEHLSGETVGDPGALAYLSDRFAGDAAPSTCPPNANHPQPTPSSQASVPTYALSLR